MPAASTPVLARNLGRHIVGTIRSRGVMAGATSTVRTAPLLACSDLVAELEDLPVFRDHVLPRVRDDRYFYTGGDYLFTGLPRRNRVATLLHHHQVEADVFHAALVDAVYGAGLTLWETDASGFNEDRSPKTEHFSVRLEPARHYLYEGALSLTMYVGQQDFRLMSFSFMPGSVIDVPDPNIVFIARNQFWWTEPVASIGSESEVSVATNLGSSLFAGNSSMNLVMASVTGIAMALDLDAVYGVHEQRHLAYAKGGPAMAPNYSQCWATFNATPVGDVAMRIPIPLDSTPIDQVSSKKRRRARQRRRLWDDVALSSFDALNVLRREPLPRPELPAR